MGTRLLATGVTIALGATVLVAPASEASVLVRDATSRLVPPSVQVQLTVDDERLVGGEQTTVTGLLLDAQTGTPVVGEELRLQSRRVGSEGWVESGSAVTDSDGAVEWPGVSSRYSTRYRVVHPLSASYARGASDIRTVVVKPTVTVELARDWVRPAGAVRLAGMVRGSYPDERVVLQRRSDGQWQDVRRATQANTGRFAFRSAVETATGRSAIASCCQRRLTTSVTRATSPSSPPYG
jgi:5-hydroxyisourate hydrolase-like protein (transthyretin family)